MFIQLIDIFLSVWLVLAILSAAYVAWDPFTRDLANLVQCATLFCTYRAVAARAALARVTFARMSDAPAVQMNGLGSRL